MAGVDAVEFNTEVGLEFSLPVAVLGKLRLGLQTRGGSDATAFLVYLSGDGYFSGRCYGQTCFSWIQSW
jgi:hypothetical protein